MLNQLISSFQFRFPDLAAKLFDETPLLEVSELNSTASLSTWGHSIPNHVYLSWSAGNKFGKTHAGELKAFRNRNLDCHFHLYNSSMRDAYMEEHYASHPILSIYKAAKAGAMKVDIWRYCILYERGGFYFDINKCIEVPLSKYVLPNDFALLSYEKNILINILAKEKKARLPLILPSNSNELLQFTDRPLLNWGLGSVSGHAVFSRVIENIVKYAPHFEGKYFRNMSEPIMELTGPIMFTRAFYDCLREGISFSARQCGIDFDGLGNPNMNGGWVRYTLGKSYKHNKNTTIL